MDIKKLDSYKGLFRYVLEVLPIEQMEEDLKNSQDPLIQNSYKKLLEAKRFFNDYPYNAREKKILFRSGVASIYSLMDPVYGDVFRYIFSQIKDTDPLAKTPKDWRINQEVNNGET